MGLSMTIGYRDAVRGDAGGLERFLADLGRVNALLAAHGLPVHEEPEGLPGRDSRSTQAGFTYSALHYLRRLQARVLQRKELMPCTDGRPEADEAVDRELTVYMRSHLICHSDAEGWYVPIDFRDVLYEDRRKKLTLPGGILGSSQRLVAELRALAPALGVALDDGRLPDDEAGRLEATDPGDPWFNERTVWLALFECARLSVELKTALVFC